jgi:hypothetical protein
VVIARVGGGGGVDFDPPHPASKDKSNATQSEPVIETRIEDPYLNKMVIRVIHQLRHV